RHTRFSRDWSSDVCSSDLSWRERLRALDPRTSEAKLDAEARALVAPEVLEGAQGKVVRQALHERHQVRRALDAMTTDERALIPRSEERRVGKEGRCRRSQE